MTYQQQPGYPVPSPPKKKRTGLAIGISLGVVTLILICCGIMAVNAALSKSTNNLTPETVGTPDTVETQASTQAGLNQAVRDGKFEFVVHAVTCGKTEEGDKFLSKTAQGRYCEVSLTVKNIGTVPQTFTGDEQKAKDSTGNTYTDDTEAELYANSANQTFLNDINPGNQVKGIVVFDIPVNTKIASLELHDSAFSNGVAVTVN